MGEAFFIASGDTWSPTPHAVGPWSPAHLHGAPVAALVGRALEHHPTDRERRLVRLRLDFVRPVPARPLTLDVRLYRPGRSIERLTATLSCEGEVVCRAEALRGRTEIIGLPATPTQPAWKPPEASERAAFPSPPDWAGYHTAVEIRVARGVLCEGPVQAWLRPRHPLVAGEVPSPVQTALLTADAGSGVSSILDWRAWSFVNADLDVVFTRPPVGEWVCLDARTQIAHDGLGTCATILRDPLGAFGRASQVLVVAPR